MKKYFFGYLFVRIAKILAGLIILGGLGFAVLKYSQASVASASASYQTSAVLQRNLNVLRDAFSTTQETVLSFNNSNQATTPATSGISFPRTVESNSDFEAVDAALSRISGESQKLKQSIVNRFEELVKDIEQRLRAHAAALQPTPTPNRSTAVMPTPAPIPSSSPTKHEPSLFSSNLQTGETIARTRQLINGREFLKVLGTKAENSENRAKLIESAEQLDVLSRLLPQEEVSSEPAPRSTPPDTSSDPDVQQAHKIVAAEKIADQIQQLRERVRQALLTSWILDEAFDQALTVASTEKERCRFASLQQRGIWLAAGGEIVSRLLAAALLSFLILVFADLTQTQLDTATNTGITAEASRQSKVSGQ